MGNVFRRHCPFLLKFLGDNYQLSIINYKLTQERYSIRNTFLAFRASCRIRTNDPEITNHVLWPTELKRQGGQLLTSRRYNQLPLLRSRPGGFEGSWPCKTARLAFFAGAKVVKINE